MPRRIFKNLVITTAGPLPGQLTSDNLRQWTTLRKGTFTEEFHEQVTHLLCTREQFDRKLPRSEHFLLPSLSIPIPHILLACYFSTSLTGVKTVKEALARGKRQHIVHCDWFEISAVNEKRQPEREYSMRNILAKQNAAKREQARVERGKREGERAVNTNFFHIYSDRTFFSYQIDITRDDNETGELGQRYTLHLWESNAKPHLYWFTAKFMKKKGDSQPSFHRPSPCSGPWRQEMDLFMEFFRIKTGIEWQDRVIGQKTMPNSFFQYAPPTGGKPAGRRLRFCYEYCLEVNAQLRGLPWPPADDTPVKEEAAATEPQDAIVDNSDGESTVSSEKFVQGSETPSAASHSDSPEEQDVSGDEDEVDEQPSSQEFEILITKDIDIPMISSE
ncbi:hypothetical protein V8C35DRAFT_330763 [Trichoderma chlorosporum]